jgi:hypothetical protein
MTLHEGEKFRCEDCNAQVAVIRSSDTRSPDFEPPRESRPGANAPDHIWGNDHPRLYCCGKAMVRYCIKVA